MPFAITKSDSELIISDWGLNALIAVNPITGEYRTLLENVLEPTGVIYSTVQEVLPTTGTKTDHIRIYTISLSEFSFVWFM